KLTQIADEGPAAKAGLMIGDIIETVDKKKVTSLRQLVQEILRDRKAGDKVTFQILRGKQSKTFVVTLGPPGRRPFDPKRPYSAGLGGQIENAQEQQGKDGYLYGGVYKSTDGGESWTRINSLNPRPMYFSQVRVDPSDDKRVYVLGMNVMYRSQDGGKRFTTFAGGQVHPDQHALWIDPRDGRHMIVGCDGGFYATYDRGANWDYLNSMAIGQFYHVAVDNRRPYHVYGGPPDNGTWGGPRPPLRRRG